jgi:hypothetical protein
MKNLAGETKADLYILKELDEAGIGIIEGERSRGEVPHTLTGSLADWNFSRAWYYWVADAKKGLGLPLDVATELHNKEYSIKGERELRKYGNVIRVAGHAGCPPPEEWADEFPISSKEKGSFVRLYHVDSQEGLNALADSIRTLHDLVSRGNEPEKVKQLHDKISSLYTNWEKSDQQNDVEWLKKLPNIKYDDRTVNELIVGIRNDNEIVSLAKKWEGIENRNGGIAQHFFKDGQIVGFNYGNISGPGQILNRAPEVDEKLRPHYEEINEIRPGVAGSLELCLQELEKPGPRN